LILKIIGCWGIGTLIAFIFAGPLFRLIQLPLVKMSRELALGKEAMVLRSLSPPEVFLTSLKLSVLVGFLAALPAILYLTARFLVPALKPTEKRCLLPAFGLGTAFFLGGIIFAYWVALPLALRFFYTFTERLSVRPEWTIQYYLSMAGKLLLGFGLVFELPVLILVLARLGIIDHLWLKKKRPYVVVGIFILAAVLTPPDVITQLIMAVPLLILFEICVFFSRFFRGDRGE